MSCRRTSRWRPAASRPLWALMPWSRLPSWHGQTRVASSCRRCPPAKPAASPAPPARPRRPSTPGSLTASVASLSPVQPRAGRGPPRQGRLGGPCPQWGRHNHRARRSRSCKLTHKTCLKEPATVPRCPVGQPARLLGPEGLSISLPQPYPPVSQGAGRQAPSPVELLTYSARWLCTVCPGPNPEPQVGTGGYHLGTPTVSSSPGTPPPSNPTAPHSLV